jgi:hypothetical protein
VEHPRAAFGTTLDVEFAPGIGALAVGVGFASGGKVSFLASSISTLVAPVVFLQSVQWQALTASGRAFSA